MRDPYQVLGVSRDASEQEVTQAYRKLAKKYHPDLNPKDDSAQKKMAEVNVAYEEIKSGRAQHTDYSKPQHQQQAGYGGYGNYGGFDPFEAFGFGRGWQQQAGSQQGDDGFDPVRRYVNAMRYNEALFALSQMAQRSAEWYYLSAMANLGLGNRVSALNHIDEAIRMNPSSATYQQARMQIQGGYQQYTQRQGMFGLPNVGGLNTLCLGICLARLCFRC